MFEDKLPILFEVIKYIYKIYLKSYNINYRKQNKKE